MSPVVAFLKKSGAENGPIGFIPTAGNSYSDPTFVREDRTRLTKLGFPIQDIDFDTLSRDRAIDLISASSALYVAGGNTFYLLQSIEKLSLRELLAQTIRDGKPYVGASAGAVILSDDIGYVAGMDDPEDAPSLKDYRGLDILRFKPLPHFGDPKSMNQYFAILQSDPGTHFVLLPNDRALETEDGIRYTMIPAEPVPVSDQS
jgi:dipeptidase E